MRQPALRFISLLLTAAPACATPPRGEVRVLARETYQIRASESPVATETLEIRTTRTFGRRIEITRTPAGQSPRGFRCAIGVAADWSVLELKILRADEEEVIIPAAVGKQLFIESPGGLMPLLRTLRLDEGAHRVEECMMYTIDDGLLKSATLDIRRAADRARRVCYQYRIDGGVWRELETDHRDLPLLWRGAGMEIVKL
ncbi:MAG: hypothetical protein HY286_11940 [Planctomycetes bacterium]|nr:hypothetical protein [Planctomycetota bacterium]